MIEQHLIQVTRYRDGDGLPACAKDFRTGEVCIFYRTQAFGGHETCVFAEDHGRRMQALSRRGIGLGSLIPLEQCPVWKDEKAQR